MSRPTLKQSIKKLIVAQRDENADLMAQATQEIATHRLAGIRAIFITSKLKSEIIKAARTNTEKELLQKWSDEVTTARAQTIK